MTNYKNEVADLLGIMIKEGASDLHLSVDRKPILRISGSLIPLSKKAVLKESDTKGILYELLLDKQKKEFEENQEIDFSYSFNESARLRGNAFYQQGNIGVVLRLIPQKIKTLEELNLPEALAEFAGKKQGFFLVVGPVGQGKSTTLASMIDLINKSRSEHIVTIEDPVEYLFQDDKSLIDQREVRIDTKDFHVALRSSFRQDVDVLMIGEMRGTETMSAAVTAAETGHLVFSTLHTNNAAQTIDRIIDSFPSETQEQIRAQLANSLLGVYTDRIHR